jgi:hypothetical protein
MSQRRAHLGRIAAAAVKSASALAVGACLTVGVGTGVAHAATSPDPLKNWSVAHIEATSIANAEQTSSLTLSGTFEQSGQTATLNIGVKKGLGCTATTVGSKTGTEKIIVIGKTVYLYLDKKFWTSVDGSTGASLYAEIKGRYMKVSSASLANSLTALCSVQQDLTAGSSKVAVSRGAVSALDGVRVLELKNSDGTDVYVTDSSKPEIFEMTSPKGSANGAGTFRVNVGAPFTLAAPPASDVINGAKYGF